MPSQCSKPLARSWFDRLTTNGEKCSVRPELVEGRGEGLLK